LIKKIVVKKYIKFVCIVIVTFFLFHGCSSNHKTVKDVIDNLVSKFYSSMDEVELANLTTEDIIAHLNTEEINILSTKYWMFDANVPTVVSIMQDQSQGTEPFWLSEANFIKTDLLVENEFTKYRVWQKSFDAGRINLGINGFDKHRPHYFVSVQPQNPKAI